MHLLSLSLSLPPLLSSPSVRSPCLSVCLFRMFLYLSVRLPALSSAWQMRYMLSVAGNYNFLEFISNAKSGEFFFFSHDERFMIKTMKV